MHTKKHVEPPDPNFAYETRDLDIGAIAKATVYFYILVIVSAPIGLAAMRAFGGQVLKTDTEHYDLRRIPEKPHPLLQDQFTAHVDMANFRRRENTFLQGKPIDLAGPRPPMPIDQAIDEEAAKFDR